MISILFIGVLLVLAGFVGWVRMTARKPRKAEKAEKGEIIRQLVALSDRGDLRPAKIIRPRSHDGSASAPAGDAVVPSIAKQPAVTPAPPPSPRPSETAAEIQEKIRRRAFELYEQGRGTGDPTQDWLEAEREILGEKSKSAAASS